MKKLFKRIIVMPYVVPVGTVFFIVHIFSWVFFGNTDNKILSIIGRRIFEPLTMWADK